MNRFFGRSKYGNKKTLYGGVTYSSKMEAGYAQYLDTLRAVGVVSSYLTQVRKPIVVNEKKICTYIIDFEVTYTDGHTELVEVKGMWTPVARLKVKLFEALYGKSIAIVKKLPKF